MGRKRQPLDTLGSSYYAKNRETLLSKSQALRDQARGDRQKFLTPFRVAIKQARVEARQHYLDQRLAKIKLQPFDAGQDKRPPRRPTTRRKLTRSRRHSAASTDRARANKAFFVAKLGGKCVMCGYSAHLAALEFDHIDPSTKRYQIALILSRTDRDRIWLEVQKCQLLCAVCHRIKTYETRDHTKQTRYLEAREDALGTAQDALGITISPETLLAPLGGNGNFSLDSPEQEPILEADE